MIKSKFDLLTLNVCMKISSKITLVHCPKLKTEEMSTIPKFWTFNTPGLNLLFAIAKAPIASLMNKYPPAQFFLGNCEPYLRNRDALLCIRKSIDAFCSKILQNHPETHTSSPKTPINHLD